MNENISSQEGSQTFPEEVRALLEEVRKDGLNPAKLKKLCDLRIKELTNNGHLTRCDLVVAGVVTVLAPPFANALIPSAAYGILAASGAMGALIPLIEAGVNKRDLLEPICDRNGNAVKLPDKVTRQIVNIYNNLTGGNKGA